MSEYQFNEAQLKWLDALESGKYAQNNDGDLLNSGGYCCLGVACVVVGIAPVSEDLGEGRTLIRFDGCVSLAPNQVLDGMLLRSSLGELDDLYLIGEHTAGSLAVANDIGATFSELAAFIRSNPTAVFKE
jgi:hypothetical protein